MSPTKLLKSWSPCTRCPLHSNTHKQVIYKGTFPATILLIGEAPGRSEHKIGKPFVGPSGQLLDELLTTAFNCDDSGLTLDDVLITNVVSCVPWLEPESMKGYRPPTKEEADACFSRLHAIYKKAKPQLVFLAGKSAASWFATSFMKEPNLPPALHFNHPSYLLRQGNQPKGSRRTIHFTEAVTQIRDFLRTHYAS